MSGIEVRNHRHHKHQIGKLEVPLSAIPRNQLIARDVLPRSPLGLP